MSVAVPIYDKYILKTRFEEAKITIQKIALAQERYISKHNVYYPRDLNMDRLANENFISTVLGVDLSKSNNFDYTILITDMSENSYNVIAALRIRTLLCKSDTPISSDCKQEGSAPIDSWVSKYDTRNGTNFYIEFKYPTKFNNEHLMQNNMTH